MMSLSEIAVAVNGRTQGDDVIVSSVGADSRAIENDQLFVAIKGERFDGNQYAAEALNQGAAAVLISDEALAIHPAVIVDDATLALGDLAAYWRQKMHAPVVAITGSNGKTTTKEMLKAILQASAGAESVHATAGNFNNDIGMPLTLLKAKTSHAHIVLEMGMNHLGEIAYLTNIAKPNVAVVGNAGTAHIGELGSRENIAKAKGEIFEGLSADGVAVINADDAFADYWKQMNSDRTVLTFGLDQPADVSAEYAEQNEHIQLDVKAKGEQFTVQLAANGKHNAYNALAAIASAVALNIKPQVIVGGLANFGGVGGRLQAVTGMKGATVIDDTYNANPDSMHAAIDVLSQKTGRKIFVMGDMAELGADAADLHVEIGTYAKEKGIDGFLSLGLLSQGAVKAFGENGQAFTALDDLVAGLEPMLNEEVVVLVKGSRSMRMERVVKAIEAKSKGEKAPCY